MVHGHRQGRKVSPTYSSWRAMINRCTNEKHDMYYSYGARGIGVTPEWLGAGGFAAFLLHVGKRPTRKHTLDRINPALGYQPGNVRWKTRNTVDGRSHREHTAIGPDGLEHTRSLGEWADELRISYRSLSKRMQRAAVAKTDVAEVFRKKGAKR
jgi:hypothetical protein